MTSIPDPETIRRTTEEVLARNEFQLNPERDRSLLWRMLLDILEPIINLLRSLWGISPTLAVVVTTVLVVVLVLLIAHIIYTFMQLFKRSSQLQSAAILAEESPRPERLEQAAEQAAAQHDYIGAVRLLFRAALLRLEEREKRRHRPGTTNREYLKRYRESASVDGLRQFVDVIDAKWYGHGDCGPDDYAQCLAAHQSIRGALQG